MDNVDKPVDNVEIAATDGTALNSFGKTTDNSYESLLCKKLSLQSDRNGASSRPVPHNRLFLSNIRRTYELAKFNLNN